MTCALPGPGHLYSHPTANHSLEPRVSEYLDSEVKQIWVPPVQSSWNAGEDEWVNRHMGNIE